MAKNRWVKFWAKIKSIALQKWPKIDGSNFGKKVRLKPWTNGQTLMGQILDKK